MIPSILSSSSSSSSARIRIPHNNNNNNKNIPIGVVEERPNPHRSQLPSHHHHQQRQQQHTRATRTTHRLLCSTTRVVRIIIVLIVIYFMIVIIWTLYIHHYSLSTGISSSILSSLLIQQHNDYELAKLESYGFFTDIDSATWHRHQQQTHYAIYDETIYYNRSYPNDKADTNPAAWLMTNVQPFFTCPNLRRLGGHGDGAKWTCDPHRFVLQQESDCLIYSVGSSGSYVFEDAIVSFSRHNNNNNKNNHGKDGTITTSCEIHVFDPEPSYARINDAINNNIHYHAWALQSSQVHKVIDPSSNMKKKKRYKWLVEYKNLYEIIQLLGHEHRRIDVLKLDCEGCEWTTYMDWLFMTTTTNQSNNNNHNISVDIRQILMETHALRPIMSNVGPESFFNAMIQNHYVLYSKEANTHPGARPFGLFYEWSWLKLHPNFFV